MTVLIGREAELSRLLGCLGHPGPHCATVVAAPGLGKSSLIARFREALATDDVTVLAARPLETEAHLAFAALGELLESVDGAEYDALPRPQRSALRAALLLDDEGTADPRALAAGVRTLLTTLAERRPMVLVIDDAHWLDDASAAALAQSLRRLRGVPVLLVASGRPTGRPLDEWLPEWPREDVELTPLTSAALFHVVREHLGVTLDRGQLRAVERASGGNPLHALEFARHRVFGPGATFEALLADRLLSLPRSTRQVLLAAALASTPTVALVAEALELPADQVLDELEPALADRLVRIGKAVQFLHPLYLEAAVEGAAATARTELHRRLAEVEPLAEARVRHLAHASTGPDAHLAGRLDTAAHEAWDRGAWSAAVDLMRLAVDRTPENHDARLDRTFRLACWLVTNGSPADAEPLLRELVANTAGDRRHEATIELAHLLYFGGRYDEAHPLIDSLMSADLPPQLRARVVFQFDPPDGSPVYGPEFIALMADANAALVGLPGTPELDRLRAKGLTAEAMVRFGAGEDASPLLEEAIELDRRSPAERLIDGPLIIRAQQLTYSYAHEEARAAYSELHRRAHDTGDDVSMPLICAAWGHLEIRAGDLARAVEVEQEGLRVAEAMGQEVYLVLLSSTNASVRGLRGDRLGALSDLDALRPRVEALDDKGFEAILGHCIARVHGAFGEVEEWYRALVAGQAAAREAAWLDPADLAWDADIVDAMAASGRLDEAEAHLSEATARAEATGRTPVLPELERARVGLVAAQGRVGVAVESVPTMLAGFEGPHRPLELAKARMTAGRIYRRTGAKRLAHEALTSAVDLFEHIGSPPYADQARAELARVGLRPRAGGGLTDSERHLATLAAEGLRNADIAAQAFVSTKTVEATLTRVYRKLGIRSRAELARALEGVSED